jgi:CTP:molybdopterin cytidylyltransferase MocA
MGTPKALLDYRGETFLDRLIRVLGAVTAPVIAVLGYHAAEIRSGVRRQANFVVNPAPERGQLSSLQTGLAVLPPDALGFAFIPMDCPAVGEETVARLVQTFLARDSDTLLVIPRYDARTRPTRPSTLSGTSQRPVEAALLQERSVVRASSSKERTRA